jgi:ADP-heptose:LPS heptosyltransferase
LKHELHRQRRGLEIRQLGRDEMGPWGKRRTLRGIEAIRGFIVCDTAATEVQIIINGLPMHRQDVRGPFPVDRQDEGVFGKYVFNIWLDFSIFSHGLHRLEVRVVGEAGEMESAHEDVVIASAVLESAYPHSDGLIAPCRDDPRPLEEQVRMRPNQVHQARREIFPKGVRNILVARTDQLGDMVASIPAMRRLRQLLPDAHIVGLLTAANADFARTLDVFDEVITVDFPDDPIERRRLMPLEEQEVLRRRLATYAFDVAIDLAQADVSRDLLLLAGAKFTYGTGGGDWPWLSADFSFHSHDRWTGHDMTPHSAKVLGLIETFGALLKTSAPVIRRSDLTRERLVKYGITPADRFAVLHTGARIGFSHWPHYHHIAERLIRETDLKVVMITDDAVHAQKLPLFVATHDRFVHLCGKLPFDDFDALLSYATVMLGNDSGPKHLASLRGTKVVTIFSARINWAEWGQENIGVVISRKVPCAGCALLHDADECGKEFACVNDIEPNGVFDEMLKQIGDAHG